MKKIKNNSERIEKQIIETCNFAGKILSIGFMSIGIFTYIQHFQPLIHLIANIFFSSSASIIFLSLALAERF